MKQEAISGLRAACLAMFEKIRKAKTAVLPGKFAKPAAKATSPSPIQKGRSWVGSMKGEIKFLAEVVAPVFDESDWKEPAALPLISPPDSA